MAQIQEGPAVTTQTRLATGADAERKKVLHEYRVASRREKRLRKADEKKQRKLNATVLRRMTRNPDKYNKNADRNRLRAIQAERRRIQNAAINQVQLLASVHDPSGTAFNIGPVVRQPDGSVISAETARRRREKDDAAQATRTVSPRPASEAAMDRELTTTSNAPHLLLRGLSPDPKSLVISDSGALARPHHDPQTSHRLEQTQQHVQATSQNHQVQPSKPRLPEGISVPSGEENWLALWDLSDEGIEGRIKRAKKNKATERKAHRVMQQNGKIERRGARDEKRKVYRDIKMIWKSIQAERTKLKAVEDEESKKIAVDINQTERKVALGLCERLGFTIANTPETEEVKPRALGMRGKDVDWNAMKNDNVWSKPTRRRGTRVNLGDVAGKVDEQTLLINQDNHHEMSHEDYIKLDVDNGQDHEALNYNHKLRRKLRRALETAQIQKELLVRRRALRYIETKGFELPAELKTTEKPRNAPGARILENGTLETAKQERVRARVELTEFNRASRVLRGQAKQCAMEAGLLKHAQLTGRMPPIHGRDHTYKLPLPAHIMTSIADTGIDISDTAYSCVQSLDNSTSQNNQAFGNQSGTTSPTSVD
ncbi:MAG: hypothetical protein Q9222_001776 [Ikaeria aurantiellina]